MLFKFQFTDKKEPRLIKFENEFDYFQVLAEIEDSKDSVTNLDCTFEDYLQMLEDLKQKKINLRMIPIADKLLYYKKITPDVNNFPSDMRDNFNKLFYWYNDSILRNTGEDNKCIKDINTFIMAFLNGDILKKDDEVEDTHKHYYETITRYRPKPDYKFRYEIIATNHLNSELEHLKNKLRDIAFVSNLDFYLKDRLEYDNCKNSFIKIVDSLRIDFIHFK